MQGPFLAVLLLLCVCVAAGGGVDGPEGVGVPTIESPIGESETTTEFTTDSLATTDFPEQRLLAINFVNRTVPSCSDNELLFFDGTDFFCMPIPERTCQCPGPAPRNDSGLSIGFPVGCPAFDPPPGGAFVCLLLEGMMQVYCSVLCDESLEFSTFPFNPYKCGAQTKFLWSDIFNNTHDALPDCSGLPSDFFRTLVSSANYLPRPCTELSEQEVEAVEAEFCENTLRYFPFSASINCADGSFFIQCES